MSEQIPDGKRATAAANPGSTWLCRGTLREGGTEIRSDVGSLGCGSEPDQTGRRNAKLCELRRSTQVMLNATLRDWQLTASRVVPWWKARALAWDENHPRDWPHNIQHHCNHTSY